MYLAVINGRAGVGLDDIQACMADLGWYRVAPNAWIIYSHAVVDANQLAQRYHHLVDPGGSMFISRLSPGDAQGWMSQDFWDWFHARRQP